MAFISLSLFAVNEPSLMCCFRIREPLEVDARLTAFQGNSTPETAARACRNAPNYKFQTTMYTSLSTISLHN